MHFLQYVHVSELHVRTRERFPVVKLDALLQLERDRLAVRTHRPALRETWLRLEVESVFEQAIVDFCRDLTDGRRRVLIRRQRWRLRLHDHYERAARFLRKRGYRRQNHHGDNDDG